MVHAPLSTAFNKSTTDLPSTTELLKEWLDILAKQIISGEVIERETAIALTNIEGQENVLLLCAAADRVRQACCGNIVDLCSIINVKSGNCSENCGFCSQSAHHQGNDICRAPNDCPI